MNANERPNFEDIWHELYAGGFDIIAGVSKSEVAAFLVWAEGSGGRVERFDCSTEVPIESTEIWKKTI
jgi:hypothetical protein